MEASVISKCEEINSLS